MIMSLIVNISQVRDVPNTSGPLQQYRLDNDSVECNNNIKNKLLLFPCKAGVLGVNNTNYTSSLDLCTDEVIAIIF